MSYWQLVAPSLNEQTMRGRTQIWANDSATPIASETTHGFTDATSDVVHLLLFEGHDGVEDSFAPSTSNSVISLGAQFNIGLDVANKQQSFRPFVGAQVPGNILFGSTGEGGAPGPMQFAVGADLYPLELFDVSVAVARYGSSIQASVVPEPNSMILVMLGASGFAARLRKR